MIYVITGNLTAGSKVVAQALMNALSSITFEVNGYTVEPHYANRLKIWKVSKKGETLWRNDDGDTELRGIIGDDTFFEIQEHLTKTQTNVYQSHEQRYFYDAMLLKGDESLYDDEARKAINHNIFTLRKDFKFINKMLQTFDNVVFVSNIAGEELKKLIDTYKEVTVIHIKRNPMSSFLLREFDAPVNVYEDEYPDDKLVISLLNHLYSLKTPGVIELKFEDLMKKNYFKVNGLKCDLEDNLAPYNKYFTKWEQENKDLSVNLEKWPAVKEVLLNFEEEVNKRENINIKLPKNIIKEMGYPYTTKIEKLLEE